MHPSCFALEGVELENNWPVAHGGFGDIWKGKLAGRTVCVKMMRVYNQTDVAEAKKKCGREAVLWRQTDHPNVLPFIGTFCYRDTLCGLERLCLVMPWIPNGNLKTLLETSPDIPVTNRMSLMMDIATGLDYLKAQSIVHGDLTPPNVLITAEGAGCLADFGLSSIFDQNFAFTHSTTSAAGGVWRYEAPEILNAPAGTRKNHASDIYAFACVSYYVLANREPFFELGNPFQLAINGGSPSWPTEIPHSVWSLFQQCWETDPNQRPDISETICRLSSSPVDAKATPGTHWDETTTARSRHALQDASLLPSPAMIERRLMGNDSVALQYRAARSHISGIERCQAKRIGTDGPSEFHFILETYSSIDPVEKRINREIMTTTLQGCWDAGLWYPDAKRQKELAEELGMFEEQVKVGLMISDSVHHHERLMLSHVQNWFSYRRCQLRRKAKTPLKQISSTPEDGLSTSHEADCHTGSSAPFPSLAYSEHCIDPVSPTRSDPLGGFQRPRAIHRIRRTFTEEEDQVLLNLVVVHASQRGPK
ncbi:kinase-like domain-containing protein [Mycena vitilis]|nr:kinase-like domain-containing protein [Mycena vitilis]